MSWSCCGSTYKQCNDFVVCPWKSHISVVASSWLSLRRCCLAAYTFIGTYLSAFDIGGCNGSILHWRRGIESVVEHGQHSAYDANHNGVIERSVCTDPTRPSVPSIVLHADCAAHMHSYVPKNVTENVAASTIAIDVDKVLSTDDATLITTATNCIRESPTDGHEEIVTKNGFIRQAAKAYSKARSRSEIFCKQTCGEVKQ